MRRRELLVSSAALLTMVGCTREGAIEGASNRFIQFARSQMDQFGCTGKEDGNPPDINKRLDRWLFEQLGVLQREDICTRFGVSDRSHSRMELVVPEEIEGDVNVQELIWEEAITWIYRATDSWKLGVLLGWTTETTGHYLAATLYFDADGVLVGAFTDHGRIREEGYVLTLDQLLERTIQVATIAVGIHLGTKRIVRSVDRIGDEASDLNGKLDDAIKIGEKWYEATKDGFRELNDIELRDLEIRFESDADSGSVSVE